MNDIAVRFAGQLGSFRLEAAFEAPGRGVTGLFGPSGCGKTTVLRCIAGLQRFDDGLCRIGSEIWQDATAFRPAHRRPVGYVFQDAALFPHLTVRRNLLFGAPKVELAGGLRFADVVDLLALGPLLERAPRHLSGGERQRVAIGRALLSQPHLLLMDEPLSALDRDAKDEIIPFLERLHRTLAIPTLYVTHDMREIDRLADHLVMMRAGRVTAAGPLHRLQSDPALPLMTARDAGVTLEGRVTAYDAADGLATVEAGGVPFLIPSDPLPVGAEQRIQIAAGDVSLTRARPTDTTILNIIPARIQSVTLGDAHQVTAVLATGQTQGDARLLARLSQRSSRALHLKPGDDVFAQIKAVALVAGSRG